MCCDLPSMLEWIAHERKKISDEFLNIYREELPSLGGRADPHLIKYAERIANWVRANECWSFECERYFGTEGKEIQVHRRLELLKA